MSDKENYTKEWSKLVTEKAGKETLAEFCRNNRYGMPVDYSHKDLIKREKEL